MGLRNRRIPVYWKAEYYINGVKGECKISDISYEGIGIDIREPLMKGDKILISFTLPLLNGVKIEGWYIIRNSSGAHAGAEIEEMSNENMANIRQYINLILKEKRLSDKEVY